MEHRGKVRFSTLLSETELWAREDWQKMSSSLSHDAFIRRSSLPLASRVLVFPCSQTTTPSNLASSLTFTVYLILEDSGQERLPSPRCHIVESFETASFLLVSVSSRFPPWLVHPHIHTRLHSVYLYAFSRVEREGTTEIGQKGGRIMDWERTREDFTKEVTTGRRGDLLEYSRSIRSNIKLASKYSRTT